MVGRRSIPIGKVNFQGKLAVKLRWGNTATILQLISKLRTGGGDSKGAGGQVGPGMIGIMVKS